MEHETHTPAEPDLKKNYIYRLTYEIICFGVPFVTTPYLSRVLGPEGIGSYSFSYSVNAWFMLLTALGNSTYGTRSIARCRDDKKKYSALFWEIESTSVISCALCLILWAVVIALFPDYRLFFLALTPYLVGEMLNIAWFYTGLERMGVIVATSGIVKILGGVAIFLFIKSRDDVVLYCFITAMTLLLSNAALWLFLPKYLVKAKPDRRNLPEHLRSTLIYFAPAFATSAYMIIDKTLIGIITKDPLQNGFYEQASRIIVVAKAFSFIVLNSVLTARMSYLFATSGDEKLRSGIRLSMDAIMFMGLGAVAGIAGIGNVLVPVFFGKDFIPAEGLIYLLLPLVPVMGISHCLEHQYFIPVGKREISARYVMAGAGANLILNMCFIPFWGAKGAAVATVLAEIFIAALYLKNCDGFLTLSDIARCSAKRIFAGIVMAAAVRLIGLMQLNGVLVLVIQILAGALIYIAVLALIRDEFLNKIFRRRLS